MPKTKQQKQEMLKSLKERLSGAKGVVFSSFSNIGVKDQENLRRKFREANISYNVFKKTLIKKCLQDSGKDADSVDEWFGNIGLATSTEDEIIPAKVMAEVAKDLEGLEIKAGMLEGKLIDDKKVLALSILPGKDQLIAKIVGSIAAPLRGFVNVLQGNQLSLVQVLGQIRDKK